MDVKILLAVTFLSESVEGSYRMVNSMLHYEKKVEYNSELERILSFTFAEHTCVQVTSDYSSWAQKIRKQMYSTATSTTFVNGVNVDLKSCNGYVLISKTIKFVMNNLLEQVNLYYDNRVLLLIGESHHKNLDYLIFGASRWFLDSEVLMVLLGKPSHFFIRKQPDVDKFLEINAVHGSWAIEKNGVSNFYGRTVMVGTFNCSIFSSFGPLDEFLNPSWVDGMEMTLARDVFRILNLTMKIIVPTSDDKWGTFNDNDGEWRDGVMGLLTMKKVDVAFCGLWIVPTMYKMEIPFPVTEGCMKALVPKPVFLDSGWFSLFNPFKAEMWIFTVISVVISSLVLYILSHLVMKDIPRASFVHCMFLAVSLFLGEGVIRTYRSLRQIMIWLITLGFILTTSYSGGLITHITSPTLSQKMDSIRLLVENDFTWTAPFLLDLRLMFDMNNTWESTMAKRLRIIPDQRKEWEELDSGKVALFGLEHTSKAFILDFDYPNELLKRFEITNNCICKYSIGLVLRKGSPYFKPINKYILRYLSGGILNKILSDGFEKIAQTKPYVREVYDVTKAVVKPKSKLNIKNLKGAFLLWALGMLVSALAFLTELLISGKKDLNSFRRFKNKNF